MPKARRRFACLIIVAVLAAAAIIAFFILRTRFTGPESRSVSPANRQRIAQLSLSRTRQSGKVMTGRIGNAAWIDGFPCAAGWVHFSESGRLTAFFSDEPVIIQGNQIPKGTWIKLNADSALASCFFPEDTTIQGYTCRGSVGGAEGVATGFYPSGRLSAFFPRNDTMVGGIPCKASSFSAVYLHENGNLKQCMVTREVAFGGRTLSEGETVHMDGEGNIQSVSEPSWFTRAGNWVKKLL